MNGTTELHADAVEKGSFDAITLFINFSNSTKIIYQIGHKLCTIKLIMSRLLN